MSIGRWIMSVAAIVGLSSSAFAAVGGSSTWDTATSLDAGAVSYNASAAGADELASALSGSTATITGDGVTLVSNIVNASDAGEASEQVFVSTAAATSGTVGATVMAGAGGARAGATADRASALRAAAGLASTDFDVFAPQGASFSPATPDKNPPMFWGDVFGFWDDQDKNDGIDGYETDAYGVVVGLDYFVCPNIILGANFGFTDMDVDFDRGFGDQDTDSYQLGLTASWASGNWFVDGGVTYSWADNDLTRKVPALGQVNKADYDSHSWMINTGVGYVMTLCNGMRLVPQAQAMYTWYEADSYTEKGSVSARRVNEFDSGTITTKLGATLTKLFDMGCVKVAPEARLFWVYENSDNTSSKSSLVALPSVAADVIDGLDPAEHSAQMGVGLRVDWNERFSSRIDYDYEVADDYDAHKAGLGIQINF